MLRVPLSVQFGSPKLTNLQNGLLTSSWQENSTKPIVQRSSAEELLVESRTRLSPRHAHLACHLCHTLGHVSPYCPKKASLAAHVLTAQVLPTLYAPVGTLNATRALLDAMSEEQVCLVAQNILNRIESLPPAPASSPPAYAAAPALCVTLTAPLSLQVLAATVLQLCTGTRLLLIHMVEVCPEQKCTKESFKAMFILLVCWGTFCKGIVHNQASS